MQLENRQNRYLSIRLVPQPNSVHPSVKLSEQEKYTFTKSPGFLRISSDLLNVETSGRVEAVVRTHLLQCCGLGSISIPKTPAVWIFYAQVGFPKVIPF